jgi:serine beta-lactamase-like protein LACTB, mitochondrial
MLLGILCLLTNPLHAQDTRQKSVDREIDAVVQQQMKVYNIPGLSIAVVQHGQVVFSKTYGWADLESRVPVTDETLFRIGSITKSITATATLMMAERHQLDLNAPVQRYCPGYSEKQWPLTTRQLLAHMGGVRGFRREDGVSPELLSDSHYVRVTDSLRLFADDPLTAKPGTHYEYSNYGYDLIGCALEGASGLRFDELVRTLILTPAGMTATTLDDSLMIIPRRSRYYTHTKDGAIANAKSIDTSNRIPAAGLLSTANDLARFVLAVESGKLLSAESIHLMWTEQTTTEGERNGYGLGWMMRQLKGTSVIAHTGEQPGSSAILCIFPRSQAGYVVLANADAAGLWKWADLIAELIK